jgi:hypothetical protein
MGYRASWVQTVAGMLATAATANTNNARVMIGSPGWTTGGRRCFAARN